VDTNSCLVFFYDNSIIKSEFRGNKLFENFCNLKNVVVCTDSKGNIFNGCLNKDEKNQFNYFMLFVTILIVLLILVMILKKKKN
jgi:predicted nucleic acid-binding Zn ribbon protein